MPVVMELSFPRTGTFDTVDTFLALNKNTTSYSLRKILGSNLKLLCGPFVCFIVTEAHIPSLQQLIDTWTGTCKRKAMRTCQPVSRELLEYLCTKFSW